MADNTARGDAARGDTGSGDTGSGEVGESEDNTENDTTVRHHNYHYSTMRRDMVMYDTFQD